MALTDTAPDFIDRVAIAWWQAKTAFENVQPLQNDALHVLAGVAIQLFAALALRSSLSRIGPWLVTALLALANEWSDLRAERWPDPSQQWGESVKDLLVTLLVPTLLFIVARRRPQLLR